MVPTYFFQLNLFSTPLRTVRIRNTGLGLDLFTCERYASCSLAETPCPQVGSWGRPPSCPASRSAVGQLPPDNSSRAMAAACIHTVQYVQYNIHYTHWYRLVHYKVSTSRYQVPVSSTRRENTVFGKKKG